MMQFINNLVSWFSSVSSFFYNLYLEVYYWPWPFNVISTLFYQLHSLFNSIAWGFYYFNSWVDDINAKLGQILSFDNIYSYFKSFFDAGVNAWNWIVNAFKNIFNIIESWWSTAKLTVQGWIDSAVSGFRRLIDQASCWLASLQLAWDSFKNLFPSLEEVISWFGNWRDNILGHILGLGFLPAAKIGELIDSAFKEREPFWAGWQEWSKGAKDFFEDPGKWILDRIEETIARLL